MLDSKECFKCYQVKPLSEFYKHRAMKDGRLNKCIECAKVDVAIHRKENLEKIRKYDRDRGKLQHRKEQAVINTRRRRGEVVDYNSAHCKVTMAIKNGTLHKETCCMCGSVMVHAHHDDYAMPLDIMWLCSVHHKARHSYLKFIENKS